MRECRCKQRGQALVELALVLPLLLLLLMAIVDFGRVLHGQLAVTTAARAAAREASMGRTDAAIVQAARDAAAPLAPAEIAVAISPAAAAREAGVLITVTVSYPVHIITPLVQPFLPSPHRVIGRTVVRHE